MRIMTWNIQDGGTASFKNPQIGNIQNILNVISDTNADVVVLQEFESEYAEYVVKNGLEKMSYTCTVCNDNEEATLRKRVLIASRLPFEECETPKSISPYSRRNWREIFIPSRKMKVLGIHVPLAETTVYGRKIDNRPEKKSFLEALKQKFIEYGKYEFPAVILGDFNLHENAVYKEYLTIFSQHLTEVTTKEATWGKNKFDYIYVNNKLLSLTDKSAQNKPHSTAFSDHKYLYIDIL